MPILALMRYVYPSMMLDACAHNMNRKLSFMQSQQFTDTAKAHATFDVLLAQVFLSKENL